MFAASAYSVLAASAISAALLASATPAASADLGGNTLRPVAAPSQWSFSFTTYGWLPWMSGNSVIKGRSLDVQANPAQILENLDFSSFPAWMSYAEARNGRLSLFNDVVYAKLSGSKDFFRSVNHPDVSATLGADVQADYEQATVEAGGAYEIWSDGGSSSATAFDLLAGARYWHQDATVSAEFNSTVTASGPLGQIGITQSGSRAIAASGSVDWVDPFVGGRLRYKPSAGQEVVVRGDIGGFGAGSDFSWEVIGTYNWQMCIFEGLNVDGYIGYRALSVDYSQGSGTTRYEYDVLQQGPVMGMTTRF